MILIVVGYIFLLGLLVGSFLNAIIDRLETGESMVFSTRSHCDSCGHVLGVWDLIPVVSWLVLRGKCRYCSVPIPIQNPLVEIATGVLFVVTFFQTARLADGNHALLFVFFAVVVSMLTVIFVYDLKHQIIPDQMIVGLILAASIFHMLHYGLYGRFVGDLSIWNILLSAVGSALPYLAIILATRGKGMGGGDLKLAFVMGLTLGFPQVVAAHYAAFVLGGVIAILLLAFKIKKVGEPVPFGPFMVIGTVLALFWGDQLMQFYFTFMGL